MIIGCECGRKYRLDKRPEGLVRCHGCGRTFEVGDPEPEPLPSRPVEFDNVGQNDFAAIPESDLEEWSRLEASGSPVASNPAFARLNLVLHFRCYPGALLISLGLMLAGATLCFWSLWWLFAVGAGLFVLAFEIVAERRRIRLGDVNPAIVVRQTPCVIAVSADLSRFSPDPRPAILLVEVPLARALGEAPPLGTRIATICNYSPFASYNAHDDVFPTPVQCAVTDPEVQQRVFHSIPESQWRTLTENLKRIPKELPKKRKLYRLWRPEM
jgi:hypothetical protein